MPKLSSTESPTKRRLHISSSNVNCKVISKPNVNDRYINDRIDFLNRWTSLKFDVPGWIWSWPYKSSKSFTLGFQDSFLSKISAKCYLFPESHLLSVQSHGMKWQWHILPSEDNHLCLIWVNAKSVISVSLTDFL